ncbi:multicomponent Na+:H+ antiporter subunit D [Roseibium hamelinense]|uniref:Multicomponent Na+:H+ antiporter subunit D n=1 Tax=Roseibium hamelinense TaxID=150831 RepID=A0A562TI23_9HYPH|nr:Na+/H+ antiporter subunit D [Roseibium hamelinense]MTI42660.1 Na+/H+ antiporter subunit D [Roseibium hamelinense]TWI93285.1 multicomponent Na+:H+ antiporter subunit D [Roseibium hamelinense]
MAGSYPSVDVSAAMVTQPVAAGDWLVVAPVLITMIGGALCLMTRKNTDAQPKLGMIFLSLLVFANVGLLARVLDKGVITMVMGGWLPPFGIAFTVDALGATLSLIASIVAFTAGLYGAISVDHTGRRYGFYPFLLLLLTGVSGAFLTGDIFNLYVWFEVLLISSYGLLVLGNDRAQLDGAVKYGILNLVGTNLFLIGTGLIYGVFGTLNMADIAMKVSELGSPATGTLAVIAALYLLAFAMKAAAFPVNFWLPASYHTPNIVVSAVFAGLLTKVGVYSLIRIFMVIMPESREYMADVISLLAIATMLTGAIGALAQTELRRLLGYLVIMGIGSMLAGLAVGTNLAISGAIFYAVHSIIVMTALYMAVGIVALLTGTYSLREAGGIYGANPAFAFVFLILAFAVSGLPPFSGFWPKVMLVDASFQDGRGWLGAAILLSGFLTTIAMGRAWIYAFWRGGPEGTPDGQALALPAAQQGVFSAALWLPLGILTAMVIYFGLQPEWMFELTARGASGVVEPSGYIRSVFGDQ